MQGSLLSVIIPCYNVEKFIEKCIDSIIGQAWEPLEIICVNDGSTDNTRCVLDKLAANDVRIKAFHKMNEGVAKARNLGLQMSKGEYVMFVDADDTLVENSLRIMMDKLMLKGSDMIVSGFNIIRNGKLIRQTSIKFQSIDSISYLKKVLSGECGWELCGKIYKRNLFSNLKIILPENVRIAEDGAVLMQIISNAGTIQGYSVPMYNYIQHPCSATHIRTEKYAEEALEAGVFIEKYFKGMPLYLSVKDYISSLFLLLYSTSTRRFYLSRKHRLVRYIYKEHYTFSALRKMPFKKAVYVCLLLTFHLDVLLRLVSKEHR